MTEKTPAQIKALQRCAQAASLCGEWDSVKQSLDFAWQAAKQEKDGVMLGKLHEAQGRLEDFQLKLTSTILDLTRG